MYSMNSEKHEPRLFFRIKKMGDTDFEILIMHFSIPFTLIYVEKWHLNVKMILEPVKAMLCFPKILDTQTPSFISFLYVNQ